MPDLQNSTPPKPSKNSIAVDIGLGLFMTMALHLLQILFEQLAMITKLDKSNLIIFFFGFTQLLYMLPAIFYAKHRNERGLMMGLIIGASITFILGLPMAGLATRGPNAPLW